MQPLWALSLTALAASALHTAIASEPLDHKAVVDEYVFQLTLPQFISHRVSRDPPTLIWDSDGCSHAPNNPLALPA